MKEKAIIVNVMALSNLRHLASTSTPPDHIITEVEIAVIKFAYPKAYI